VRGVAIAGVRDAVAREDDHLGFPVGVEGAWARLRPPPRPESAGREGEKPGDPGQASPA
jgi:hypothetical protein